LIVIYKPFRRMEFIFHNSYASLELAVFIQTFHNVTVFLVLSNFRKILTPCWKVFCQLHTDYESRRDTIPLADLTPPHFFPLPTSYVMVFLIVLRREAVFRFSDIGEIVDHYCIHFLFNEILLKVTVSNNQSINQLL